MRRPFYKKKQCVGHDGTVFNSINEMCRHYGITPSTLNSRLKLGWTWEAALTGSWKKQIIGRCEEQRCGLNATVIEKKDDETIVVQFEDGAMTETTTEKFSQGLVRHPELGTRAGSTGTYRTFHWKYIGRIDEVAMYACTCSCGLKDILTARQMAEHECGQEGESAPQAHQKSEAGNADR